MFFFPIFNLFFIFWQRSFLVMFDPQAKFLPDINPANPGKRIDILTPIVQVRVCVCVREREREYMHIHIHTCIQRTYIHTYMRTYIHT